MIYQKLLKRVTDSIVVDFCKLYILLGLSDFFSNKKDLYIVGCLVLWIIILVNYVNTCNVIKLCSNAMSDVITNIDYHLHVNVTNVLNLLNYVP